MTIEHASTLPPPATLRQFTPAELDARFPIDCTILPRTREVKVSPAWERENLVRVRFLPSFGIGGSGFLAHKAAADHFRAWFDLIALAKLQKHIATFNGCYSPRLKRGDNVPATKYGLSRHARGLAIDINSMWNPMSKPGAQRGETGCVLDLVSIAESCDLVWGGHWAGASRDDMHFELGTRASE